MIGEVPTTGHCVNRAAEQAPTNGESLMEGHWVKIEPSG